MRWAVVILFFSSRVTRGSCVSLELFWTIHDGFRLAQDCPFLERHHEVLWLGRTARIASQNSLLSSSLWRRRFTVRCARAAPAPTVDLWASTLQRLSSLRSSKTSRRLICLAMIREWRVDTRHKDRCDGQRQEGMHLRARPPTGWGRTAFFVFGLSNLSNKINTAHTVGLFVVA